MEELIQEAKDVGVQNEEQFEAFLDIKRQYPDDVGDIFARAKRYHYGEYPFSTAVGLAIVDHIQFGGDGDDDDYEDDWDDIDDDDDYVS